MAAKGKFHPGDAANAFVRVILSDAGAKLGGLTPTEWDDTFKWFEGRCAYTGDALVDGRMDRDHAIPMNRKHCGLHLYGNVLPATREANRRKTDRHYRHFVEDPDRLERIESFVRESGYWERVSVFGDLQRYCEAQYRSIDAVFVYRVEARKSAKWCAGLVRMCRYVQYGSRGRQTWRFEGARARG